MSGSGMAHVVSMAMASALAGTVLCLIAAGTASAERVGVTAGLGLGTGWTYLPDTYFAESPQRGWGGLAVSIGGFLDARTAILLRVTGSTFDNPVDIVTARDSSGAALATTRVGEDQANAFAGFVMQRWLLPVVALGGGVGIGAFGDLDAPKRGIALDASITVALVRLPALGVHATSEVVPAFYDFGTVTSALLLVELQWY